VSRGHCLDCGDQVVIDPAGRCPEGHHVGALGARIEGALGSGTRHPDEPEPWVARVEIADDPLPAVAAPVREIRPPAAPPAPAATASSPPAAARADDLLRELHSLAELGGLGADGPSATPPVATNGTPAVTNGTPAATNGSPAAPTNGTAPAPTNGAHTAAPRQVVAPAEPHRTPGSGSAPSATRPVFDELTALEAAVQALTATNGATGPVPAAGAGGTTSEPRAHDEGATMVAAGTSLLAGSWEPAEPAPAPDEAVPGADDGSTPPAPTFDDLFAPTPPPSPAPATAPPVVAPAVPPPAAATSSAAPEVAAGGGGLGRWAVLADIDGLADADLAPADPVDDPSPEAAPDPTAGIDLGNFTARGKRVGNPARGRRRLFGR
jgi:hypothetical protein